MQLNANQRVDGSFCNHPGTSLKKPPLPTTLWHTQLASNARVVRRRRCCKRGEGGHTSSSQWRKKKGSRSDVSVFFSPSILFFGRWEGAMSTLLSSFFFGYFIFFYNSPLSSSSVTSFRGGFGYKTFFPPSSLFRCVQVLFFRWNKSESGIHTSRAAISINCAMQLSVWEEITNSQFFPTFSIWAQNSSAFHRDDARRRSILIWLSASISKKKNRNPKSFGISEKTYFSFFPFSTGGNFLTAYFLHQRKQIWYSPWGRRRREKEAT